jgi:hypothetical protein
MLSTYTREQNGIYKNHSISKNTDVLEQPQRKYVSHIEVNFNTRPLRYVHLNYFTNNPSSLV